jgi:hypothetical protein
MAFSSAIIRVHIQAYVASDNSASFCGFATGDGCAMGGKNVAE